MRLVGDVQDHPAAVDPADIRTIRLVGGYDQRVHADAGIERRYTGRRRLAVTFARAWQPPAAGFTWMSWIAHIDDQQELVVELVARGEVARAGGQISVVAISEPY